MLENAAKRCTVQSTGKTRGFMKHLSDVKYSGSHEFGGDRYSVRRHKHNFLEQNFNLYLRMTRTKGSTNAHYSFGRRACATVGLRRYESMGKNDEIKQNSVLFHKFIILLTT